MTRKLARIRATVVDKAPDRADPKLGINAVKERDSGPAIHVRTADGTDAVLYVNPDVTALMPTALDEGGTYAFVVRDTILAGTPPQFDLISFEPASLMGARLVPVRGRFWRRRTGAPPCPCAKRKNRPKRKNPPRRIFQHDRGSGWWA